MEPLKPIQGEFMSRDVYERSLAEREERRTTNRRYTRRSSRRGAPNRAKRLGLNVKIGICVAVCLLCVLIKVSDSEFAQKSSQVIQNALTYDLDFDESVGQLKFVRNIFPGLTTVFNGSDGMRYPISGNVSKSFEDMQETGIEITGDAGAKVVAAMEGRVEKRGKNAELGNYLRISHSGGMDTYYYNLSRSSLNEGDEVKRGQEIAELGDDGRLVFEVHVRGNYRNPMTYLGKN